MELFHKTTCKYFLISENCINYFASVPWGAWLIFILASRYPYLAKRLVLVSSGPFLDEFASQINSTRLSRLCKTQRSEAEGILKSLEGQSGSCSDQKLARLGEIFASSDSFDPLNRHIEKQEADVSCQTQIYQSVWKEAEHLRRTGELLEAGRRIICPVVAIHGDWDPHPAGGVREPLSSIMRSFQFILLPNCGHSPWMERQAKDKFYSILKKLIA